MPIIVERLSLYPVKAMRGHDLRRAIVERCGLQGDRRWMVVDPAGRFLTQRDTPMLARIDARPHADGLLLDLDGAQCLARYPVGAVDPIEVTVWRDTVPARLSPEAVSDWLSERLDKPCRLVFLDDPEARPVDPRFGLPGDTVSFADGYPLLAVNLASLDALNEASPGQPVGIERFRANLVLSGLSAWEEDRWQSIRIGATLYRAAKPCARCMVITRDQRTGAIPEPGEPLRTLARLNRHPGGAMFGMNLVPETPGTLSVGDEVTVQGLVT